MNFRLRAFRFHFRARDTIVFPRGKAGNVFRGAFGLLFRRRICSPDCTDAGSCPNRHQCPYARLFEPVLSSGPSGLKDPPRAFCLRAAHLDDMKLPGGTHFYVDVHVFEMRIPVVSAFVETFQELADTGLGSGRGRAVLQETLVLDADGLAGPLTDNPSTIEMSLLPTIEDESVRRARVQFRTPTELKGDSDIRQFGTLFARTRDRISALACLYGDGPLEIDFRALGNRAASVRLIDRNLQWQEVDRRSSKTGAVHGIGGFTGEAVYEGELAEFLPWLRVAFWTGIGRHTVWGNGIIAIDALSPGS